MSVSMAREGGSFNKSRGSDIRGGNAMTNKREPQKPFVWGGGAEKKTEGSTEREKRGVPRYPTFFFSSKTFMA